MPSRPPRTMLILLSALLIAGLITAGGWLPASSAERAGWRADLADLESHVSRSYANLEWFVTRGRVDPRALHDSTLAALERARTRRDARRALQWFAAAFEDGHFRLSTPMPAVVTAAVRLWDRRGTPPAPGWGEDRACRALGYSADDREFGLPFDRLDGFAPLPGASDFPAGLVPLADGRHAGVLRISLFSTYAHASACAEAWRQVRDTLAAQCGDTCAAAIDSMADMIVLDRLTAGARALASAGAGLLVVDLTGNGGGEDIVDPMARILTPIRLRGGPRPVLRHPHAIAQLETGRAELAADLDRAELPAAKRQVVESAQARMDSLIAEARRPCDWSRIWRGGARAPSCSMLVTGGIYSTGLLDYAAPGSLDGLASRDVLFSPSRFTYEEGAWTGPLVVLVDHGTASAAEGFAAILRDNGAATVLGERTWGAGCGYTDGGIRHVLPHTGLDVRLPDCVRSRADGSNEVDGVMPDITVPWRDGDDGLARARLVREVLSRVSTRATIRPSRAFHVGWPLDHAAGWHYTLGLRAPATSAGVCPCSPLTGYRSTLAVSPP
jgi:hypothetical protein